MGYIISVLKLLKKKRKRQKKIMGNFIGDIIICILLLFSVSIVFGTTEIIKYLTNSTEELLQMNSYNWILRLCFNLLGYATILFPGYLIYKYVQYSKYIQRSDKSCIPRLVHSCFLGHSETGLLDTSSYTPTSTSQRTFTQDFLLLTYCFLGLQISYLTWGYLQEKIMTQVYEDGFGNQDHFEDSQFLVFINRILAFLMSALYLLIQKQPQHKAPLYKYVFCSLSNIMSSWCQYEALKYVSFPTQVLAKASKIIPVMIMGKIISHTTYEYYEYVTAILISVGMTMFMLNSSDYKNDGATTISGIILLGSYLVLDSFTSTWQNALFVEYGTTSIQMMCAVNMFSCLLTVTSLIQQSSFPFIYFFMKKYPRFIMDCLLISICSASGQLYIFYTISKFGPITFVIMMTIRQGLAILLSCLIYHHEIKMIGILGILLVFGSVFLRIHCNNVTRAIKRRRTAANSVKN
ncbi:adenosine 3'-phospho 5'-phosphosulfate transporter 1-like [Vespa mandarinia]|uniref:adenosine 3'-phospho 5'-phosphosulfate transporter 1-like n=1 Tax=Vespa mandarinia TaxID=7446 RepID=UPI00161C3549|nr:adenosine 3'-phospho 5'-phosphosulfate transporter 1-like [Vespa mandarinia]XP_046831073.1 adenosine 3'-phospho 5'-phosphosulfate transporter 1 [Vespa crabro]XP_047361211.1 adenosine 3'-phospho 5'-phosphosulfate transporter 1 [Vespa velutina]